MLNSGFFVFFWVCPYRWNAARALAGFLQRNSELYLGRSVLELGAGGGLPGLVAVKCGARKVLGCLLIFLRVGACACVRKRLSVLAHATNCD